VPDDAALLLRLLVAMLLAGAIGWERETVGKSAGLRTHMFVGMGATLFVVLGDAVVQKFGSAANVAQLDPLRMIEAVTTAVAFLGGGVIFVTRSRDRVHGLTTAASMWVTAAIGIAVALERYVLAGGATVLALVVLHVLARIAPDADRVGTEREVKR
jgi:putative Mg2+ transporter-C (MgtC) family protein